MTDNANHNADDARIRRILAAIDAATGSLASLEAAVELAARLGAELDAVFIEDIDLLSLTDLPFVIQVSNHGTAGTQLRRADLEAELRVLALQARRRLAAAAERRRVQWTFRAVRGQLRSTLTMAAEGADLLVLERTSRPFLGSMRLRSPAWPGLRQLSRTMLLLHHQFGPNLPVTAVFEGGPTGRKTLATAALVATGQAGTLDVLVVAPTAAAVEAAAAEARQLLVSVPAALRYRVIRLPGPMDVDVLARASAGGVLVINAGSPVMEPEGAWDRLAEATCSILLVR